MSVALASLLTMTTGLDLKVERIRARVTATDLSRRLGVSRQRVSQIEALGFVPDDMAVRYRGALSVTSEPQKPVEAAS